MKRTKPDAAALARQLAQLLAGEPDAANDDEPVIDEDRIRELARREAERMRRARRH